MVPPVSMLGGGRKWGISRGIDFSGNLSASGALSVASWPLSRACAFFGTVRIIQAALRLP